MNTVPTINANSIINMTGISGRPVYFLTLSGNAGPTLTVKGEQKKVDAEISIKWGSKLMKNVNDAQVNTKIMDGNEITEFRKAARAMLAGEPAKLTALNDTNLIWVKMPFVPGLTDADVWKKDDGGKYYVLPPDVKKLFTQFTQQSVWVDLGKVIAVDVFNGNSDRFVGATGDWQNQGNVMFQGGQGNAIKVVGLDTFDPNSGSSNLTKMGNTQELDVIKSNNGMTDFATKVIASVEEGITRAMSKSGSSSITVLKNNQPVKITPDSAGFLGGYLPDLVSGIQQGTSDLKMYLQGKKRQYALMSPPPNKPLPPIPGNRQAPLMGQHRNAGPQQPVAGGGAQNRQAPMMGSHRNAAPPQPPKKSIPQGILDRMAYLNW